MLGKPSPDGRITLYTKEECDILGGNWHPNGECLKKEGGSFSWDNRPILVAKPVSVKIQVGDSTIDMSNVKFIEVKDASGNVVYTNQTYCVPGSY